MEMHVAVPAAGTDNRRLKRTVVVLVRDAAVDRGRRGHVAERRGGDRNCPLKLEPAERGIRERLQGRNQSSKETKK